jgi:hypothetical protein
MTEPKPLSGILPSLPATSTPRPSGGSPSGNDAERRASLLEGAGRRLKERVGPLLPNVRVPGKFRRLPELEDLGWKNKRRAEAAQYCIAFVADPLRKKAPLLMGPSGTGKSVLLYKTAEAMAFRARKRIMEEIGQRLKILGAKIDNGEPYGTIEEIEGSLGDVMPIEATSGAEIAHDLRASIERRNLDEIVYGLRQERHVSRRAVLFVDDIEVMKMSDWLHEELYRIFDFRYMEEMPTPMATNLSPAELGRHLGDRLSRRIQEMTEPFIMD